jgi:hypothetical protein
MKRLPNLEITLVLGLGLALTAPGCYTQVGSVREEPADQYQTTEPEYYGEAYDSTARIINNYYFGAQLPSPYYRFSFSYYYPSYYWGWYYDPFFADCYSPFFYNPWICGTPFITYGYPWYYRHYAYGYPYYGGGFYHYPRGFYAPVEPFRGSRNFGSTRGSTSGVRGSGSTRGTAYTPPPAIPTTSSGSPTVGTSGSRTGTPTVTTTPARGRTEGRSRTESTVGKGTRGTERKPEGSSSGRSGGSRRSSAERSKVRSVFPPSQRPPAEATPKNGSGTEEKAPPSRDAGRQERGGRESYTPSSPQRTPSSVPAPSGGSRDSGGRGGSSGGNSSSGGGGRSGGGTRGSR